MDKRKMHDSSEEDEREEFEYSSSSAESGDESDESDIDSDSTCSSESDSNNNDPFVDIPWTNNGSPRPPFPMTGNSGIKLQNVTSENILELFESFFSDDLISIIVKETNRYAYQFKIKHNLSIKKQSRVHDWTDTNSDEIKTFLGLLILQGLCSKPETKMYFSHRESISTPFYSRIISERRFHLIQKFLHFANNEDYDSSGLSKKLFKINPILNHLRKRFMASYVPEKNVSVDESLIAWKGRLGWKQYIPSKRKRFGMKMFSLCESQSGYVYNFILYTGSGTVYGDCNYPDEPVSSRVVLELMHPLLNQGYCIFLDNYYNSVNLSNTLAKYRTDSVGTMRINRKGIPLQIKKQKLKKGDHVAMFRKKLMVLKWRDKKDITMISSTHDNAMQLVKIRGGNEVQKPIVVLDYNKNMGGVDLADNHLHFYSTARSRMKKYYMKIFRHFLDLTALNCYLIYKKLGGKESRLNFMMHLGESLIEKYAVPRNVAERKSKTPRPSRLIERHFPDLIPPTTKQKPRKRCVVCYENGKRKESRYWCNECKAGLCPAPCFKTYHTKHN